VQNRSGNGIDIVSRTPDGRLAFTEVKTSRTGNIGDLSVRQQNMSTFIEDVLGQAASRQGRYKNISLAEQQQARQMLREFRRAPEMVSGNLIGVDLQSEVLRVSPWARN
jgi:filamentous hemagglutinin